VDVYPVRRSRPRELDIAGTRAQPSAIAVASRAALVVR